VRPRAARSAGAGSPTGLGKVGGYHSVRLGLPRPGGCREASVAGSLNGGAWSVPFSGRGEWCGQSAAFTYQLGGRPGGTGRLEYRHDPPAAPAETFTGTLPQPPATAATRDPSRRVDSAGCGRRPPIRPGRSGDLEVAADPALSAGAERRSYRVHVPTGYRQGRPAPAVLLLHGNRGTPPTWTTSPACPSWPTAAASWPSIPRASRLGPARRSGPAPAGSSSGSTSCASLPTCSTTSRPASASTRPGWAPAGFSAGGGVTARIACELAGRVDAVATVAAGLFTEAAECRPSRPIAVLSMHGTADEALPYGGQAASVASPLPLPALPTWLAEWATRDGCPDDPDVFLDTAEVTGVRWSGCRDGTEVVHYRINGGGHQAPRAIAGRPFAEVVWDFFAAHPLPG
jgi:polyhydroxybutyrate depolymerase